MSLIPFLSSLIPGTWGTKQKNDASWHSKAKKLVPHYLLFQNRDFMKLQNGDLLKTHDGAIDWRNKEKQLV